MSKGYCLYKGKMMRAEKDGNSIKIIAECEMPGLEKVADEHGQETWQGCVPADECEDYWEAFMRANVNGEMVDIRLSSEGNWIIFSAVMMLLMVYARKLFTDFSWSIASMINFLCVRKPLTTQVVRG